MPGLLRETAFRRFWLGQTISVFGDQITLLALPIVAVTILGADPAQMGALTAIGLLPHLLFSLPAGAWLDRIRQRRRLMVVGDLVRAGTIGLVPLAFLVGGLSINLVFVLAFVVGTVSVFFDLAWMTLFASVARRDQYVEANSLLNGSRSVASVGGPAIAGVLIQLLRAPLALVADALSFVASAFFLSRIQVPDPPIEHDPGSIRAQLSEGLGFLVRDPILRHSVFGVATVNLFNYGFNALFILFATRQLGVEPGLLGLALGAGAVGSVIGAVIAPGIGRRLGIGAAYVLSLVVFPASTLLVPLAAGLPQPAILAMLFGAEFIGGIGVMILDINGGSLLLARVPERRRGRVGGAFRFVNMGVRPIGAALGGVLGGLIGVRETLLLVSIAQFSGLLWIVRSPVPALKELPEAGD